jgi:HSP20 family molecular chaperone IbpA
MAGKFHAENFHLRSPGLQLCCQHELAVASSGGYSFGRRIDFRLAQFQPQKTQARLLVRLRAGRRPNPGEENFRGPFLKSDQLNQTCRMAVTKVSSTTHFFHRQTAGDPTTGRWTPNTDIYLAEAGLVIKAELAGMKSDSLEITVEGQRLRITGVRPDCCRSPKCSFLVMEISYGPFETTLDLPPGYDLSQARAVYVNGFLRIDVPAAQPAPRKATKVPITEGT